MKLTGSALHPQRLSIMLALAVALMLPASAFGDAIHGPAGGPSAGSPKSTEFMHARYYSSGLARFLTVDPVGGEVGSSQSWNRYSYALNNPIRFIDPQGLTVQVADDTALERIRSTLPENIREDVILDSSGNISREAINAIESSDANFLDLKELVNADAMLGVSAGPTGAKDGDFFFDTEAEIVQDLMRSLPEDQAKALVNGPAFYLGHFFEPGEGGFTNPWVVLSDATGGAADAPASQLAKTSAHEIYGHGLLFIQGRPHTHDSGGPVDRHIIQIEDRTK